MSLSVIRSTFVTVLAWIFIGLSGFGSFIAILQNLMVQLLLAPTMAHMGPPPDAGMPAPFACMTLHMAWFFRAFLLLNLLTLGASIGLLRRRHWGRLLFIALLVLGIVYQIGGLVLQWWMVGGMHEAVAPAGAPREVLQGMQVFMTVMRVFSVVTALGLSGLFGWLIARLCRPAVREEFAAGRTRP